ncbi:MAG: AAA family ATPase, partial [Acidimicrobiales bacterium]
SIELTANDLPDGYRSILAILADIVVACQYLHPSSGPVSGSDITGIALIDEVDLHLHARLQRDIVTRLRDALPNMQFVVTTHSPLVAASFEREELVLLDREAPGGIRHLDRQILAFTADEVYEWLLDTRPYSEAGRQQLEQGGHEATRLLYQSPEHGEAQAEELLREQEHLLQKLRDMPAD